MLGTIIKIVTLPIVLPVKIVARLLSPRRIVRRFIKKRTLIAIGAASAVAAHQHSKKR